MDVQISVDRTYLTLITAPARQRFHAVWLRDNARDAATRSASNGQRLITLLEQPSTPLLSRAVVRADRLHLSFDGDATQYEYSIDWLTAHAYDRPAPQQAGWVQDELTLWGEALTQQLPRADFTAVSTDEQALASWLGAVQQYGFALLQGLPEDPAALLKVVDLFGYVRETNYGPFFEVRAEVNPVNLAYTNGGLQAHTDNPYRDPVPTLQLLACIENTTAGGESIVVDGFQAVRTLQRENAAHFDLLAGYCARFSYTGSDDVELHSKRPMIALGPDGELLGMCFNNRSAAAFTDIPFDKMQTYYQAYRHLAEIIERPENQVMFKLQPGELFIVDNTRVLHSRRGFSGEGMRWLRGCYADKDGLLSTLRVLHKRYASQASDEGLI